MTNAESIAALTAAIPVLSTKDQAFAGSMLAQYARKGYLSDKQWFWVEKLASRPSTPKPATVDLGDMAGVIALFDRAANHLKHPAIVLHVPGMPDNVRLYVAGSAARVPGSVNVSDETRGGNWYGRIHRDGRFEPSPRIDSPANLASTLTQFAANPAKVATEHGKLTGKCCFCNTRLTDERSTSVGYGPVCASHYGLAWGKGVGTADMFADQRAMQAAEAAADRAQTMRDEANKQARRAEMESPSYYPDPGELAADRWTETHF